MILQILISLKVHFNTHIVGSIVIAVSVKNDSKTLKEIWIAKHRTWNHAFISIPDGKSIPIVFLASSMDFEMDLKFPIADTERL